MRDLALLHRVLSEPTRLAIAQQLLREDLAPGEIGQRFELSSSLVAHHVAALVDSGIAQRRTSENDARRSYLRLSHHDPAVTQLVTAGLTHHLPNRIVFVCTRNSARSKLAAALGRQQSLPCIDAGTRPAQAPHPQAVALADKHDLELDAQTHHLDEVLQGDDLLVAVCDNAHETLPRSAHRLHWSIPDPVPRGNESAFRAALDELSIRLPHLLTLPPDTRSTR